MSAIYVAARRILTYIPHLILGICILIIHVSYQLRKPVLSYSVLLCPLSIDRSIKQAVSIRIGGSNILLTKNKYMIITRGYNAIYLGKISNYLMYLIILLVEARKLA